jgi:PhoPQ-activated pathogenicity-related protein
MSIKLRTVTVESIRKGDSFMSEDGPVWTAISDAYESRDRWGVRVVAVDVQHHPDGGLDTRHFTPEMEWSARYVRRAKQGHATEGAVEGPPRGAA